MYRTTSTTSWSGSGGPRHRGAPDGPTEADPQRRFRPRPRWTPGLFVARLEADARSVALALRLFPWLVRKPRLARLVLELGRELPPGRAHRIAREAGEDSLVETPLWTAQAILRNARVQAGQRLVELGSGPGRLSLIAAATFGLRCEALERVAGFVEHGNRMARRLGLEVLYREQDLERWTPEPADWAYVAGTLFPESLLRRLGEVLAGSRTTVISVTAPLPMPSHPPLLLGSYPFLWGRDRVYVQPPA
jgi:hypothetical protein